MRYVYSELACKQSGLYQPTISGGSIMRWVGRRALGFVIYYSSFFYYLVLLPRLIPGESAALFRSRLRRAIRLTLRSFGVKLAVHGIDHLASDGNAIIVANHSSWFDQLALLAAFDQPVTFMANRKYFRYWGLATVLNKLQCVPTSAATATESMQAGRRVLEQGMWLVVYPEGTRTTQRLPFRRGAAVLSEQTSVPVQPIVIRGAEKILPRRRSLFRVRPGTIELNVQPLVTNSASSAREFMATIERFYASSLAEQVAPEALAQPVVAHNPHLVAHNPHLNKNESNRAPEQLPADFSG